MLCPSPALTFSVLSSRQALPSWELAGQLWDVPLPVSAGVFPDISVKVSGLTLIGSAQITCLLMDQLLHPDDADQATGY